MSFPTLLGYPRARIVWPVCMEVSCNAEGGVSALRSINWDLPETSHGGQVRHYFQTCTDGSGYAACVGYHVHVCSVCRMVLNTNP